MGMVSYRNTVGTNYILHRIKLNYGVFNYLDIQAFCWIPIKKALIPLKNIKINKNSNNHLMTMTIAVEKYVYLYSAYKILLFIFVSTVFIANNFIVTNTVISLNL